MKPHAFVAMPFGVKPGFDGQPIDFDRVYAELIRPALQKGGCEVFRADEEQRAGDILADMFQELLVADLVLADLTLDNPNVWYELGVRHALRARGVVLVQGPRPYQPFDNYTDRKLRYTLKDGAPDPARRDSEIEAIAAMVRATITSGTRRKVSPVYQLLPHLEQPEWRRLLLSEANEFSEAQQAWDQRMETARQKRRAGDVLLLANETPTRGLQFEAKRIAGAALMKLEHYDLALEEFRVALGIEPRDKLSRMKTALCLGRLGRVEEARESVQRLAAELPADPDVWALAGRVEKEHWESRWRREGLTRAQWREAAAAEDASLGEAIEPYLKAFVADPRHHVSGVYALMLMLLRRHLGGEVDNLQLERLVGGVAWSCAAARERQRKDYGARASDTLFSVLTQSRAEILRDTREAMALANGDWMAIGTLRRDLQLLDELGLRPEDTAAALAIVEAELARAAPAFQPRQVILFSGHRMDPPGRDPQRFPADKEPEAARRIAEALQALDAGAQDLALTQAAAGGDLLFLEACQARGVRCEVLLPFAEPDFIDRSVRPSEHGDEWCERYYRMAAQLPVPPRIMDEELGPTPPDTDINPFERCNLWLLYTALAWGPQRVRFIGLWDGGSGDGRGGTQHMMEAVKRHTGRVTWIDTRTL